MIIRIVCALGITVVGLVSLVVWNQPAGAVGVVAGASLLIAVLGRSAHIAQDTGLALYVIAIGGVLGGIYGISRGTGDGIAGGCLMLAGAAVVYVTGRRMSRRFRA